MTWSHLFLFVFLGGAGVIGLYFYQQRRADPEQERKEWDPKDHSRWEAWSSFEEGAWVEFELETTVPYKQTTRRRETLATKEPEQVVIRAVYDSVEFDGTRFRPAGEKTERVILKKGDRPVKNTAPCASCGKPVVWPETKVNKTATLVAGDVREAVLIERPSMICGPKKEHVFMWSNKTWYSCEVPGWVVKQETDYTKMKCIAFGFE